MKMDVDTVERLNLKDGDVLVVQVADGTHPEQVTEFKNLLTERLHTEMGVDVSVLVLAGAEIAFVLDREGAAAFSGAA